MPKTRSHERIADADAVVVLGAQVLSNGRPSPTVRRRVEAAVDVWRSHGIPVLVGCGGTGNAPVSEAEAIRDLATAAGVPFEAVVLEAESTSTLEHALNLRPIARDLGWRTIVIVTDRFHLPRAAFLFRRCGFVVAGVGVPRSHRSWRRWYVEGYLREVPAWVKALWQVGTGHHRRGPSALG